MYEFSIGQEKTKINYKVELIGDDLDITITGGKAHIGCIVIITNNSYNLLNLPNHREDEIIKPFIKKFRNYNKGTILIKAGFHIDDIALNEITDVLNNNKIGIKKIEEFLESI